MTWGRSSLNRIEKIMNYLQLHSNVYLLCAIWARRWELRQPASAYSTWPSPSSQAPATSSSTTLESSWLVYGDILYYWNIQNSHQRLFFRVIQSFSGDASGFRMGISISLLSFSSRKSSCMSSCMYWPNVSGRHVVRMRHRVLMAETFVRGLTERFT